MKYFNCIVLKWCLPSIGDGGVALSPSPEASANPVVVLPTIDARYWAYWLLNAAELPLVVLIMPGLIAGGGEIAPAPPAGGGGTWGVLGVLGRLDIPCKKE